MRSSHIHEPQIWEAIISPFRNALGEGQPLRSKGHVAYLDFAKDYAAYLNAELHMHAWPKGELTHCEP